MKIPRTFRIFEARFLSLPAFPALPKTRSKWRLSNASPQSRQTELICREGTFLRLDCSINTSKSMNLLLFSTTMTSPIGDLYANLHVDTWPSDARAFFRLPPSQGKDPGKEVARNARMDVVPIEFATFVSEITITSKRKSSSSNNNPILSRLRLLLTILLWKIKNLHLAMFSGSFSLNSLKLCREKYRLWMRWLGRLNSAFK